jgi:uncharacterized protein YigA (DUF484 family)
MAVSGPAQQAGLSDEARKRILNDPGLILDDPEMMRALVLTSERALGGNVVDMRSMAMERLEFRLSQLEETHRAVIAAAYENLASTNQIHRALMTLLDADTFEAFVMDLGTSVAEILRVDSLKLVLESPDGNASGLGKLDAVLRVQKTGYVETYMTGGRPTPPRPITLRQGVPPENSPYGKAAGDLRSEALMRLDLGKGRLPGMLAMGSEDPHRFKPGQGTDLVTFFSGAFERLLRRWLG